MTRMPRARRWSSTSRSGPGSTPTSTWPEPGGMPVRIARVEAVPLDARLKTPFRFGNVVRTPSANVLVRIVDDDGLVGYGEACPVPQLTAETQESVVALIEQRITPELVGE